MTQAPSGKISSDFAGPGPKSGAAAFDFPMPRILLAELDLDEIARAVDQFEADARGLAPHRIRLKGLGLRLIALAEDLQAVSISPPASGRDQARGGSSQASAAPQR